MCKHLLITKFNLETDMSLIFDFADRTHDRDGFGAIMRTIDNSIHTLKSLSLSQFYAEIGYIVATMPISEIVVHHRTSTNGAGIAYAHPFEYKGNYLTHNGVVTVPDKHDTLTTNDSEALLHHLIKTDYNTETISGYFSCFILNDKTTTVLVDDTAPIYSDNRVFCSHPLSGLTKISLERITFRSGEIVARSTIKVTKSSYGYDKASLSLGWVWEDTPKTDQGYIVSDSVDDFFDFLSPQDEFEIQCATTEIAKIEIIQNLADYFGIKLTTEETAEIAELF